MTLLQHATYEYNPLIKSLCSVLPTMSVPTSTITTTRFPMATICQYAHFAIFLLLFSILPVLFASRDDLVIGTTHGKVQGKLLSVLGGEVRAFLGIPYAKPPVGKLRFHPPEPVESWQGVKEATKFPNTCYQIPDTTYPGKTCLYTDIL